MDNRSQTVGRKNTTSCSSEVFIGNKTNTGTEGDQFLILASVTSSPENDSDN